MIQYGRMIGISLKSIEKKMSNQSSDNNKRIAKNTLLLYFRMLFMLLVSLYTSRVILKALGVEDYGIYNVVGGVVAMFSMISTTLASSISRFLTFELGKQNEENTRKVFSTSVTIQLLFCVIILIIAETVGLWFVNAKLVIPHDRLDATNWVYQFSLLSFCISLVSVPYNAAIVAHEKMSAFAYISIIEATGKLIVAYLVMVSPMDKLIFYALLLTSIAIIVRIVYGQYCVRHFRECRYNFQFDKALMKKMFGFAGWNFIGASSMILRDQGCNILINLFFGPAVNAARGIANQVNTAVVGFVTNFQTALNPQIIKNYASGNIDYTFKLAFQGARLSFYILLILSLPIILNTHYILTLWLGIVPEHTTYFIQLVLIVAMHDALANPLVNIMMATGNIRNYQLLVGGIQLLNLPLSFVWLKLGGRPECIMVVALVCSFFCMGARLIMLKGMVNLPIRHFVKKVYLNVALVSVCAAIIPCIFANSCDESFLMFCKSVLISVLFTLVSIFYVGCNGEEKRWIINKFMIFLKRYEKIK